MSKIIRITMIAEITDNIIMATLLLCIMDLLYHN
jgi:hypothetical protein